MPGSGWGASQTYTGNPSSVICDGSITATLTGTGPGSPPPSVIVLEQCSTSASVQPIYNGGTIGLWADDGFGDASVRSGNTITCSGSRNSVRNNPGTSFTVSCDPAAQ